jgi:dephospho-CoA kinase
VIGLVGGVASGKSFVAKQFESRGAVVVDADRAGHEVLRHADVIEAVRQRWGDRVLAADGQVDRRAVAQIVFDPSPASEAELAWLEKLTHPRIGELLRQQIAAIRTQGTAAAIVLDAPVLLKAGWDRFCDHVVFVECPAALRQQRVLARGWSRADLERRERAQESLEIKRSAADLVIDNSGPPEHTAAQIDEVWPRLTRPAPPRDASH